MNVNDVFLSNCHNINIASCPQSVCSVPGQILPGCPLTPLILTHYTTILASNEGSRKIHYHGEGPYWGPSRGRGLLRDYEIFANLCCLSLKL